MIEEFERVTKVKTRWHYWLRNYIVKCSEWVYWYWPYVEDLVVFNVLKNQKLTIQKIDEEFKEEEIQKIIVNINLYLLKIKHESFI